MKVYRGLMAAACLLLLPVVSHAQIEITLKNSFIEKYKDLTTIDATFTVDTAHRAPNPPAKDGDMHIAGRAPQIGLATVAEIMNAASESAAVALVHSVEGTGDTIHVTGAWRIWCEHAGIAAQIQGAKLTPFTTTNPPHVFEIHPITQLGPDLVVDSWVPIDGYTPKEAGAAFLNYENRKSQISMSSTRNTTTITTTMAGYNYVEFKMVLNGAQQVVADGRFVMAQVLDLQDELLVHGFELVVSLLLSLKETSVGHGERGCLGERVEKLEVEGVEDSRTQKVVRDQHTDRPVLVQHRRRHRALRRN